MTLRSHAHYQRCLSEIRATQRDYFGAFQFVREHGDRCQRDVHFFRFLRIAFFVFVSLLVVGGYVLSFHRWDREFGNDIAEPSGFRQGRDLVSDED